MLYLNVLSKHFFRLFIGNLETYKKNVEKPNFSGLICFLLNMNTCMYIFVKLDILTRFMPFKKKNNI